MSEQKRFDEIFNDVFDGKNESSSTDDTALSPIARKLKERKKSKTIGQYVSWLKMADGSAQQNPNEDGGFASYTHSLIEKGKHFSLIEDTGVVTIAYQIFKSWSFKAKKKILLCRKIRFSRNIS